MPENCLRKPGVEDIVQASKGITGKAIRTPLVRLRWDCPDGTEIYLKLENLQPINSFKVRPAANALSSIADKEALRRSGVSTASAGNFAQGLAWCCKEQGIPCTVVAPDHAPKSKLREIARRGATVITVPFSEWWEIVSSHKCPQAPAGAIFIHPGAENAVLAGNATIAWEVIEDLPDVDCIIAPFGSGALCAGIACGVEALGLNHQCEVIAVEPETAAPFTLSMEKGRPMTLEGYQSSFVDGCGGQGVLADLWPIASQTIRRACAVPLADIAAAITILIECNKVVAEGAGACAVAAALAGVAGHRAKKVVCIVSGGGIDTDKLIHILQGHGIPTGSAKQEYKSVGYAVRSVCTSRLRLSLIPLCMLAVATALTRRQLAER